MPKFELSLDGGKSTYEVEVPEGQGEREAYTALQGQLGAGAAPAAGAPSGTFSTGKLLNDIPRQIGLFGRYALQGPAEAAQLLTEPARRLVTDPARRMLGDDSPSEPLGTLAERLADKIGLPRPQNPLERVVGRATRLGLGSAGIAGGANAAANLLQGPTRAAIAQVAPNTATPAEAALRMAATNPGQQVAGAVGAGGAGQASQEAGGTPTEQFIASLAGGLGGQGAAGGMGVSNLVDAGARQVRSLLQPQRVAQDLDLRISRALQGQRIDFAALPEAAKSALRQQYQAALNTGGAVDDIALGRLADFAAVGATPTRGMISQNPGQITREQNLAKMQAQLTEGGGLPETIAGNNRAIIGRLNDLGASRNVEPAQAGRALTGAITDRRDALRAAERQAWNAAETAPGMDRQIATGVLSDINEALGKKALTMFLPKEISAYMGALQRGEAPFTPREYANLRSMLSSAQAEGGNVARAATRAVEVLDAAKLQPIKAGAHIDFGRAPVPGNVASAMRASDSQAGDAIGAVNEARRATRNAYNYEDSNPLVRSVLSEGRSADPERIAKSFILGGTADEARTIARELGPGGSATVRDSLIAWLKKEALSGRADEVASVSQARLNGALNKLGDEKLRVFFTADEIADMKRLGRVAALMQNQPAGSAVNNSNSGTFMLAQGLDALSSAAKKLPMGKAFIADPLENWRVTMAARQAQNVTPALLPAVPPAARPLPLLLPGLAAGGAALSAPEK